MTKRSRYEDRIFQDLRDWAVTSFRVTVEANEGDDGAPPRNLDDLDEEQQRQVEQIADEHDMSPNEVIDWALRELEKSLDELHTRPPGPRKGAAPRKLVLRTVEGDRLVLEIDR